MVNDRFVYAGTSRWHSMDLGLPGPPLPAYAEEAEADDRRNAGRHGTLDAVLFLSHHGGARSSGRVVLPHLVWKMEVLLAAST